jgi:hypothetical protein
MRCYQEKVISYVGLTARVTLEDDVTIVLAYMGDWEDFGPLT